MSSSLDDLEPFEIFQNELDEYLKEYLKSISSELQATVILQHSFVINSFIEYICFHNAISNFESMTPAMANIEFPKWLNHSEDDKIQEENIRKILKGYFEYINKTHDLGNEKMMSGLE